MNEKLRKKLSEKSIEFILLDFLDELKELNAPYALVGGVAFSAYTNSLIRQHSDIDILTSKESFPIIKDFLEKRGFVENAKVPLVKQFEKENSLFHVDVLVDNLYYGNPPDWEILGYHSLETALENRIILPITSLNGTKTVSIAVVPPEENIMVKLSAPVEPINLHDILYLVAKTQKPENLGKSVKKVVLREEENREYFLTRIKNAATLMPDTIWYKNSTAKTKEKVKQFFKEIL